MPVVHVVSTERIGGHTDTQDGVVKVHREKAFILIGQERLHSLRALLHILLLLLSLDRFQNSSSYGRPFPLFVVSLLAHSRNYDLFPGFH